MTIIEKMKTDWDRRARVDARYWVDPTFWKDEELYRRSAISDTASLMDDIEGLISKESRILDIGCGIGRMMEVLADRYKEVHGVDVSGEMVEIGRKRLAHRQNVRFYENSGVDLVLFENNRFDFVYSYAALPHMPKSIVFNYFNELSRVLKYKGICKVQLWKGTPNNPAYGDTLTPRVFSEEEFERLYKDSGFELIAVKEHEYLDPVLMIHPVWCSFLNKKTGCISKENNSFDIEDMACIDAASDTEAGLLLYYGSVMMENGNTQKAKKALKEAVELNPESMDGYNLLAAIFLEEGDITGAIEYIEMAVKRFPGYKEGHFYLNKLYRAMGREAAAS